MRKSIPVLVCIVSVLVATLACAGAGVPSSSPDVVGTIVAGTMAATTPQATPTTASATSTSPALTLPTITLPTLGPSSSSVPPTLQPVAATVAIPGAIRINFLTGATEAVVSAQIQAGQALTYVLQAFQAQPMLVNVDSPNQDVVLSIKTQGGTNMLNAAVGQSTWQGTLPQTEDYYLTVHGGASTENFTMTVIIPSRIRFAQGADSAKVTGKTVGGFNVLYTAFAIKGQKMTVELSSLSGDAALTIYGFSDGQPYVRSVSEQTNFNFVLPATQDYIIEVVPRAGETINYVMTVKIQ